MELSLHVQVSMCENMWWWWKCFEQGVENISVEESHWLLVASSVTMCCTKLTPMPWKLCSMSSTRPLDASCENGSLTISHRHLEMIFTDYRCHRGSPTHFAPLSTSVCTSLLRSTIRSLECLSWTVSRRRLRSDAHGDLYVIATRTVTYMYDPRRIAACAPSSGTAFQPHFDTWHWRWHRFVAG